MSSFVIDADGHIMEDHKDIFAHIKGNFAEMDWHATWPMFDADGWQRLGVRRSYTANEMAEMLREAGLTPVRRLRGAFGQRYAIAALPSAAGSDDDGAPDPIGAEG